MCNLYRLEKGPDAIRKLFDAAQIPLGFPEGVPNFEPRDVHITDRAPIVRAADAGAAQLVERRWSWPGPTGKPVYNLRSDNREFPTGRCLVLADGFYEYTAPADPKQKRKDRWLFTPADGEPFAIAGFVRDTPGVGEAFSLLTTIPSADVAPYHNRQVVLLRPPQWKRWLNSPNPAGDLLQALPAGSLKVEAA
jgi:putative SOS response-associated peptidase YedK